MTTPKGGIFGMLLFPKNSKKNIFSFTKLKKSTKKENPILDEENNSFLHPQSRNFQPNQTMKNISLSNTVFNSSSRSISNSKYVSTEITNQEKLTKTQNFSKKNIFSASQNTNDTLLSLTNNNSKLFPNNTLVTQKSTNQLLKVPHPANPKTVNQKKKLILSESMKSVKQNLNWYSKKKKKKKIDYEPEFPSIKNTLDSSTTSSRTKGNNTVVMNSRGLSKLSKKSFFYALPDGNGEKNLSVSSDNAESTRKKIKLKLKAANRPKTPKPFTSFQSSENNTDRNNHTNESKKNEKVTFTMLAKKNNVLGPEGLSHSNSYHQGKVVLKNKSKNVFTLSKYRSVLNVKAAHEHKTDLNDVYYTSSPRNYQLNESCDKMPDYYTNQNGILSEVSNVDCHRCNNADSSIHIFHHICENNPQDKFFTIGYDKLKFFEDKIRSKANEINENVVESKQNFLNGFYHKHYDLIESLAKSNFEIPHNLTIEYHPEKEMNSKETSVFENRFISLRYRKAFLEKKAISLTNFNPTLLEHYFPVHLSQKIINEKYLETNFHLELNLFSRILQHTTIFHNFSLHPHNHNHHQSRHSKHHPRYHHKVHYHVHRLHHKLHDELILPHYHGSKKRRSLLHSHSQAFTQALEVSQIQSSPTKTHRSLKSNNSSFFETSPIQTPVPPTRHRTSWRRRSVESLHCHGHHISSTGAFHIRNKESIHNIHGGHHMLHHGATGIYHRGTNTNFPRPHRHISQIKPAVITLKNEDIQFLSSLRLRDYVYIREPNIDFSNPQGQSQNPFKSIPLEKKFYQALFSKTLFKKKTQRNLGMTAFQTVKRDKDGCDEKIFTNSLKKNLFFKRKKLQVYVEDPEEQAPRKTRTLLSKKNPKSKVFSRDTMMCKTEELKYLLLKGMTTPEEVIFFYIKEGNYPKFSEYFEKYKVDPDSRDPDGNSMLSLAVQSGSIQIVNHLIYSGANINSKNNKNNTPLHYALTYHNYELANILIKNGANENIKNRMGATPWECLNPNISIV